MKFLILIFCVFVFDGINSSPLNVKFVNNNCIEGPKYWCTSLSAAAECKAITHCQQTVWSKQVSSNNNICSLCKLMINEIRINVNKEELFKIDQKRFCQRIPDGTASENCYFIASSLLSNFNEIFKSETDTETFCQSIVKCNDIKSDDLQVSNNLIDQFMLNYNEIQKEGGVKQPTVCSLCKLALTQLKLFLLTPEHKLKVIKYMQNICEKFSHNMKANCLFNVNKYGDFVLEMIIPYLNPLLCDKYSFCLNVEQNEGNDESNVNLNLSIDNSSELSETSNENNYFNDLSEINEYSIDFINDDSVKIFADDSFELIDNTDELIDDLDENNDNESIESNKSSDDNESNEYNVLSGYNENDHENIDDQIINVNKPHPGCHICKQAIKEIEKLVMHKSEHEINVAIRILCDTFGPFKRTCVKYLSKNKQKIVELIFKKVDPKKICHELKLCSSKAKNNEYQNSEIELNEDSDEFDDLFESEEEDSDLEDINNEFNDQSDEFDHLFDSNEDNSEFEDNNNELNDQIDNFSYENLMGFKPVCGLCKKSIQSFEERVKGRSKDEIRELLEHTCDIFTIYRHYCTSYLRKHTEIFIEQIYKQTDPEEICEHMKLC